MVKTESYLGFWSDCLNNAPTDIKYVIVYYVNGRFSGLEGYKKLKDALGDIDYQKYIHPGAMIFKVTKPSKMIAVMV